MAALLKRVLIRLWFALAILALAGVMAACGGGDGETELAQPPAATSPPVPQQGRDEAQVIDLTMAFVPPRFQPGPITVKVGEPIQFAATSISGRHQLVIEELGIDVLVPQPSLNETALTDVVVPKNVGEFPVVCSIHTRIEMETTLVVTE